MTDRLPDLNEANWAAIMGARNSSGGFLRVAHNDDGTLKALSADMDAGGHRLRNLAPGVAGTDAANVNQASLNSGYSASIAPSGDTSGAEDEGVIQAAIDAAFTAGGGTVQLQFAPNLSPFWITQIKPRGGVVVQGVGRQGTVLKAPLGQPAGRHMVINDPTATEGNHGLWNLTIHGNNGFANNVPATWGQQVNSFDGIQWVTSGAGGLGSLVLPFNADHLMQLYNVQVVSVPGKGVYLGTAASGVHDRVFTYWTGDVGITCAAYDLKLSNSISGFAGVALDSASAPGASAAWNISSSGVQLSNCAAWWPQTNFHQTNPITWDAPTGIGYNLASGKLIVGSNLYAQDCGYGYAANGATSARIRGHAQNCKVATNIWSGDDIDMDVTVDYENNGSLVNPQYAFASVHGAAIKNCKVRVKYASSVSFSNGPGYFDTNGTALAGSDVDVRCAGSQAVAYASTVTPTPYQAPIHYIGTLTGNITIAAPTNTSGASNFTGVQPYHDQEIELHLTQDGFGGHTVTFNAAYGTPTAIPTTAGTTTVIKFRWDSATAKWREIGRSTSA